jgi:hypothetical protein
MLMTVFCLRRRLILADQMSGMMLLFHSSILISDFDEDF